MTGDIGPEYRRLMDQIRSWITSGEYQVGQPIPSTAELNRMTGRSIPVVRRAVDQLKADGILEGHPGKGVFVKAMPEEADSEHVSAKVLSEQMASMKQELADLRHRMGRMEARIETLPGQPRGGKREQAKTAADGGRR